MKRFLINLAAIALTSMPGGNAQAPPDCPAYQVTVTAMRGCYRLLLVFSPSASNTQFQLQQAFLAKAADAMADRNLLYLPVLENADRPFALPHVPSAMLPENELIAARKRLHIIPGMFRVILLGKDGGVKLSSASPVSMDTLSNLIDTMPMRRNEMRQGHSN